MSAVMIRYPLLSALVFLALINQSSAEPVQIKVTEAVPHGKQKVGVGSKLTLQFPNSKELHEGQFLGKLIQGNGRLSQYLVLDETQSTAYLLDKNDAAFSESSLQPVIRPLAQVDGTCTGYGMDHFMEQMHWSGFIGNGNLTDRLSTEKGRTQLLVEAINNYYLVPRNRFSIKSIMNKFGLQFGFTCEKQIFTDRKKAIDYVEQKLASGLPVMVSFNVGSNMVYSDIAIQEYKSGATRDPRLWIPRKVGERLGGGHTIVAVSEFKLGEKKKLLMLDSDWSDPRIWDLETYIDEKTALDETEFYSCR